MISIFPIISQLLHVLHKFIVVSDSSVDPFLALYNSDPVIELRHKQTPLSLSLALSELCNKNISTNVEATSHWCRPAVQALIVYVSCVKKISKYCFFIFVLPSPLVFVFCYRKLTFISIPSDFVFFFCLSKTFIFVLQLWKSKHQIIVLIKKIFFQLSRTWQCFSAMLFLQRRENRLYWQNTPAYWFQRRLFKVFLWQHQLLRFAIKIDESFIIFIPCLARNKTSFVSWEKRQSTIYQWTPSKDDTQPINICHQPNEEFISRSGVSK